VGQCETCIQFNHPTSRPTPPALPFISSFPRQYLICDIVGPVFDPVLQLSSSFLVTLDHFTRYACVVKLRRIKARNVILALEDIFQQLGDFQTIITDPGSQFRSKAFELFVQQKGAEHHLGSTGGHRSTSPVERLARTLKEVAAKFQVQDLHQANLVAAVRAYNDTVHSSTGAIPSEAFFDAAEVKQVMPVVDRRLPLQKGDFVLHYPVQPSTERHAADRHLRQKAYGPFIIHDSLPFNRFLVYRSPTDDPFELPASQLRRYSAAFF
jgi:hypothetical protein